MYFTQELIAAVFYCFATLFVALLLTKRLPQALMLLFAVIPLKSIYIVQSGFFLELWKFFAIISFPLTIGLLFSAHRAIRFLLFYFLFSSVVMVGAALGLLGSELEMDTDAKFLRVLGQVVQLGAFLNLALIPYVFAKGNLQVLDRALGAYLWTTFGLALLGLLQYIAFLFYGVNLFPIPRLSGEFQSEVFVTYVLGIKREGVFRVNSLSMEPKNFAMFLTVALIILVERIRAGTQRLGRTEIVTGTVLVTCLFLTRSSLGYIVFLLYVAFTSTDRKGLMWTMVAAASALTLLAYSEYVREILEFAFARTVGRVALSDTGYLEDFDLGVLNFFVSNPEYLLTGMGHGNTHLIASDYLPEFAQWAAGTTWHAKAGLLYVVAGSGLFGFALLFMAFYSSWVRLSLFARYRWANFSGRFLTFFALVYIVRANEFAYVALGVAIAVSLVVGRRIRAPRGAIRLDSSRME